MKNLKSTTLMANGSLSSPSRHGYSFLWPMFQFLNIGTNTASVRKLLIGSQFRYQSSGFGGSENRPNTLVFVVAGAREWRLQDHCAATVPGEARHGLPGTAPGGADAQQTCTHATAESQCVHTWLLPRPLRLVSATLQIPIIVLSVRVLRNLD